MPTYDYACADCGEFSVLRPLAQRDAPCACPQCGQGASRVLVAAPTLATLAAGTRKAHALNERSAHAPRRSGQYQHVHGPGCGCGSAGSKTSATVTAPDGSKSFAGKRPWMISH